MYHEISISNPHDGHVETFNTIRDARRFAKTQPYTPVFINLYDENGIVEDIRITNPKQPIL